MLNKKIRLLIAILGLTVLLGANPSTSYAQVDVGLDFGLGAPVAAGEDCTNPGFSGGGCSREALRQYCRTHRINQQLCCHNGVRFIREPCNSANPPPAPRRPTPAPAPRTRPSDPAPAPAPGTPRPGIDDDGYCRCEVVPWRDGWPAYDPVPGIPVPPNPGGPNSKDECFIRQLEFNEEHCPNFGVFCTWYPPGGRGSPVPIKTVFDCYGEAPPSPDDEFIGEGGISVD